MFYYKSYSLLPHPNHFLKNDRKICNGLHTTFSNWNSTRHDLYHSIHSVFNVMKMANSCGCLWSEINNHTCNIPLASFCYKIKCSQCYFGFHLLHFDKLYGDINSSEHDFFLADRHILKRQTFKPTFKHTHIQVYI